jgi:LmbE family N-acetylglucosaminyl deacetylase
MHLNSKSQPGDVYLSPHPDDICFSLGNIVSKRHTGQLITVFTSSIYQAKLVYENNLSQISAGRLKEDCAFAMQSNLALTHLGFYDSMARGHASFDRHMAKDIALAIEDKLINELFRVISKQESAEKGHKPLLFCPAAIGGHVDHLAVLFTIARWQHQLKKHFHILFYEDLFYASDAQVREEGLSRLFQMLENKNLARESNILTESDIIHKMKSINLYQSQIDDRHRDIYSYTPATKDSLIHEAIWFESQDCAHALG